MRYNLKHPTWVTNPARAKELFEKELGGILNELETAESKETDSTIKANLLLRVGYIREILGENLPL